MAKATTKLNAQDRVILFCAATGIDHAAVGILANAMQSMAIRGFIAHDRESGAHTLTDSGRAPLGGLVEYAALKYTERFPPRRRWRWCRAARAASHRARAQPGRRIDSWRIPRS